MFKHYLLTRYNIGLYDGNPYKIKDRTKWMADRLDLFKECAASVKAQSCKKFEWFIFIDPMTRPMDGEEILDVLSDVATSGLVMAHICRGMQIPPQKDPAEWIITTRMDNDDRLNSGFIEAIQNEFDEKTEVIDVKGLQLDLKSGKYCKTDRIKPNSPFISLIEKTEGMRTVFQETHSTLYITHGGRFVETSDPLYYQVIHGANVMNKLTGSWL